jgi:hypothetical protein
MKDPDSPSWARRLLDDGTADNNRRDSQRTWPGYDFPQNNHVVEQMAPIKRDSYSIKSPMKQREFERKTCCVCGARADVGVHTATGTAAYYCAKHLPEKP